MPKSKTYKQLKDIDFSKYKAQHLRAAKELCYSKKILQRIEEATTEGEITRAMITGRREMSER